jgi:DNA mismatch repair ATPase MutL
MESSGPKIHSLAAETSHRVSTSQVIASLAGALRELIDNSIDSGATQIG